MSSKDYEKLFLIAGWLFILLILVPTLALAADRDRVDLFDTQSRRTGYAIIDRKSGRVDYYDVNSRRTGYGKVDETGKAERFKLDGTRDVAPSGVLPPKR